MEPTATIAGLPVCVSYAGNHLRWLTWIQYEKSRVKEDKCVGKVNDPIASFCLWEIKEEKR